MILKNFSPPSIKNLLSDCLLFSEILWKRFSR